MVETAYLEPILSFSALRQACEHSNASVQEAAILASPYLGWKQLREPLEALQQRGGDIGEQAGRMITLMERHNWQNESEKDG